MNHMVDIFVNLNWDIFAITDLFDFVRHLGRVDPVPLFGVGSLNSLQNVLWLSIED